MAPQPRRETVQADRAEIVPIEGARAIAVDRRAIGAAHREPDPAPHAASRPIDLAEVLPAEIATGREWAERTLPPERWMDRSDCGSDV